MTKQQSTSNGVNKAIILLVISAVLFTGCKSSTKTEDANTQKNAGDQSTQQDAENNAEESRRVDEFIIEDITEGSGVGAVDGDQLEVDYVGTLINGTKFDSSYDFGQPFTFTLGQGRVIAGWDQGLVGMKVGGKRKLTIPANLAYGPQGVGNAIPPSSTLIFEIELLKIN